MKVNSWPVYGALSLLFLYFSSFFSITSDKNDELVILFLFFHSVLFFYCFKIKLKELNSVSFLFFVFYLIYGVSAPFSLLLGGGIPDIFNQPYLLGEYLYLYSIATTGIVISFFFVNYKESIHIKKNPLSNNVLMYVGMILCILALIMDLINNFRVGFVSVFQDKAVYQSQIQSLSMTLPAGKMYICAVIVFSLGLSREKLKKHKVKIFTFIIFFFPTLMIHLVSGQRGFILSVIICSFLSLTYHKSINSVNVKYILLLVLVYFSLVVVTVIRGVAGYAIENNDYQLIYDKFEDYEVILKRVNPAESEFGAPFGNLNEYLINNQSNSEYVFGYTYLISPIVMIPSFIYPGDKPDQAIYEFRNKYFSSERYRGDIASTGYSPILEAFHNFGSVGILFIFFIVSYFMQCLLRWKFLYDGIFYPVFVCLLYNVARVFHRSDMSTVIGEVYWAVILALITSFIYKVFFIFKSKGNII
ncbi:O-antigen polysaccharide polymerase Wzy [Vibrio cyclitrophicus]